MKKIMTLCILAAMTLSTAPAFAGTHGVDRQVTGKSIAGGIANRNGGVWENRI